MCRIWGISLGPGGWAAEGTTPTALARRMFAALAPGGPDAWGWMSKAGAELDVQKRKGFVDNRRTAVRGDAEWIVAHTRLATHGAPTSHANNHPVRHHGLLGVHNGILRNHEEILERAGGRYDPTSEVDSEAIFAAVRRWGVKKGLPMLRGTFAAAWVDTESPGSVWITRGRNRPLVFGETEAGSLVWASEARALRASGLRLTRIVECTTEGVALRVHRGKVRESVHFTPAPTYAATLQRSPKKPRRHEPARMTKGKARKLTPPDERHLRPVPQPDDWEWSEEDVFDGAYAASVAQRRGRIYATKVGQ